MASGESRNTVWIDCAKLLAILGVLIDHCKGILYEGETVQYLSFFSVSVFFFLSGMTSYYSLERRGKGEGLARWTGRRLVRILVPYCVAVAVCQYVRSGTLDLGAFVRWTVNFNLEGQFYFVLIYLQFILAGPILYLVVAACRRGKPRFLTRGIFLVAAWECSLFCIHHTFALETYGGGNYLLGGTYFFLFVMGMIAADMRIAFTRSKQAAGALLLAAVLYCISMAWMLKDRFAWDESVFGWVLRVNPPGPTLILYALAVLFLVFSACSLACLMQNRWLNRLLAAASWLGRRTLYIFLYHMLILDCLLPRLPFAREMGPVKTAVYMAAMVGLPVAGKEACDRIKAGLLRGLEEG